MKCPIHRRYSAKRRPRCLCEFCWAMWCDAHRIDIMMRADGHRFQRIAAKELASRNPFLELVAGGKFPKFIG